MSNNLIKAFIIIDVVACILFFATSPSSEEKAEKDRLKYKDGPVALQTNDVGCTKYEYFDTKYWSCTDKNIKQVEEEVCTSNPGRAASCNTQIVEVRQ